MTAEATFAYRARDASGQIVTGSVTATSAQDVTSKLRAEGKYVVSVEESALGTKTELDAAQVLRNEAARRVKRDDVIAFAQQLSVMLEAGVPLTEAIETFRRQCGNLAFAQVLNVVAEEVYSGEPLSSALSRWPRVFPNLMVSLMKASEMSGTLSMMLGRVGGYLAKERRTVRQIRGALAYPIFMLTLGLSITVFLMAVVLPRFAAIYEQRSARLPTPTKILVTTSDFLVGNYMYYLPALAIAAIGMHFWMKHPHGKRTADWVRLNAPILRRLFGQLYITRAARTMSTLLGAGVNLLDIISITRGVTNNVYWDELWDNVENNVRNGRSVSDAFAQSPVVPPNVASMITAGDRSGQLPQVMERIAIFSEDELDNAVKQTTAMIEPLMICIMGAVVGAVAIALLLPIFTMGRVVAGG